MGTATASTWTAIGGLIRQCRSKFFDRVQHDVLLVRVARKVHDKRLLKLMGRFLRAGVLMADGVVQPSPEGTMQGGPLSPLMANILLDDFDKELEQRGLRFVRYADDFQVFVRTPEAAERVDRSVEKYLTQRLKLVVNQKKSRVCSTNGVEFLGYQFHGFGGQIRVSAANQAKFKRRAQEITRRNRGVSMSIPSANGGSIERTGPVCSRVDGVLLSGPTQDVVPRTRQVAASENPRFFISPPRLFVYRMSQFSRSGSSQQTAHGGYWKWWRLPKTKVRKLLQLEVRRDEAYSHGNSRKGPWRMSGSRAIQMGMPITWLHDRGLLSLEDLWNRFAPKR